MIYERTDETKRYVLFAERRVLHILQDSRLVDIRYLSEQEMQSLLGQHDWRKR